MIEIDKDKFEALEQALLDCATACKDVMGLKIGPFPRFKDNRAIQSAACLALASLTDSWVRPKGLVFINMTGNDIKSF